MAQAAMALDSCDLFITVGTSSVVYPAAGFAAQVMQDAEQRFEKVAVGCRKGLSARLLSGQVGCKSLHLALQLHGWPSACVLMSTGTELTMQPVSMSINHNALVTSHAAGG